METPEEEKERYATADAAFKEHWRQADSHVDQVKVFSSDAMKAPAFVAAGGVVAVLGFYSANYARLAQEPSNLETLNDVLFWLFISLLLTAVAPGVAYLSQIAYVSSVYSNELSYVEPFVKQSRKSRIYRWLGDIARWTCVGLVLLSIVALSFGGILFLRLVA